MRNGLVAEVTDLTVHDIEQDLAEAMNDLEAIMEKAKKSLPPEHFLTVHLKQFHRRLDQSCSEALLMLERFERKAEDTEDARYAYEGLAEALKDWVRGIADWVDIEDVLRHGPRE